uniref:Fatty acid-binding protein n=1 Tax=Hemiscolopendra marginata TaxID=943146 RepID=A0A646QCX0_9MYRI
MARAFISWITFNIRSKSRPVLSSLKKEREHGRQRLIGCRFITGAPLAAFAALVSSSTSSYSAPNVDTRQLIPPEMAEFVGKYKLISSENFDEYMKALGVGMMTRKMANAATPVQDIVYENGEFYIKTSTTFKTTELRFKLDQEFDETTGDGRQVKTIVTKEGNKLIQQQKGEKPSTITREFEGDTMKMVLVFGDITCTRVYKKE